MAEYDGRVRIGTELDTKEAEKSAGQLGDKLGKALDFDDLQKSIDKIDKKLDDAFDAKQIRNASDAMDDFGDSAKNAGEYLKANITTELLKAAVTEITQLSKQLYDGLIGSNGQMEQYTTSFETMLGSIEDAEELIVDLRDFAADTPLELTGVVDTADKLMSYGTDADDVITKLTRLGDLAKGNQEMLGRLSTAYGQMLAKGKVTGEELLQMTEAGVPMLLTLADTMGVTTTEVSKLISEGAVSIDVLDAAIESLTTGTGKFAGMMENQSKTLDGMISTLNDNIDQFGTAVGAEAFEQVKELISGISEEIDKLKESGELDEISEGLGEAVGELAEALKGIVLDLLPKAVDKIKEMSDSGELTKLAQDLGNALEFVANTIFNLTSFLIDHRKEVAGAAGAYLSLKAAISIGKVIDTVVKSFRTLKPATDEATAAQQANNAAVAANPYVLLAGAIAGVIGGIATFCAVCGDAQKDMADLNDESEKFIDKSKEYSEAADGIGDISKRYKEIYSSTKDTAKKTEELNKLQDELVDTYGAQAEGIDLVNGKLDEEIAKLQEIAGYNKDLALANAEEALRNAQDAQDAGQSIVVSTGFHTFGGTNAEAREAYKALDAALEEYIQNGIVTGVNNAIFSDTKEYTFGGSYEERMKALGSANEALKQLSANGNDYAEDLQKQIIELWNVADEGQQTLQAAQNTLAELDGSNALVDDPTADWTGSGAWIAAEEQRKYEEAVKRQEAAREAALAEREAEQEANAELYKQLRKDAKYQYDMGELDAAAYYTRLARLRDDYLVRDSEDWQNANVELKKYYDSLTTEQQKAIEEAAKAREKAYSEAKSQLDFKFSTQKITEEQYYKQLAVIRDKYLDKNSDAWRSAYLETYKYNQQIVQANKDALSQLLSDASDTTLSALESITSARDSLTAKLTDFNKTYEKITETVPETIAVKGDFTVTTSEHQIETYRMGADSIEDNIKVLEEYGAMLDALKARGADSEMLNEILAMDVDEGMEFGAKMLAMSDKEWREYFDSMARLRQKAAEISANYYQDEIDSLKTNFVDKMRDELEGLGSDMYLVGADVAAEFVAGWNEALGTKDLTLGQLTQLLSGTASTAPAAAQQNITTGSALAQSETANSGESKVISCPIYIGTTKIADVMIDAVNGKMIQTGKNVLLT